MNDNETPKIKNAIQSAGISTTLVYLTTSIHHIYGGIVYNTPWRSHVAVQGLLPLLVSLYLLRAYNNNKNRIFIQAFAVISGTIFVGAVGLWEGGWNHGIKILSFATGSSRYFSYAPAYLQPPVVQPPNDLFFESTGVLTFIFGLISAYYLHRLLKYTKKNYTKNA